MKRSCIMKGIPLVVAVGKPNHGSLTYYANYKISSLPEIES